MNEEGNILTRRFVSPGGSALEQEDVRLSAKRHLPVTFAARLNGRGAPIGKQNRLEAAPRGKLNEAIFLLRGCDRCRFSLHRSGRRDSGISKRTARGIATTTDNADGDLRIASC